jgi:hypothetical protein
MNFRLSEEEYETIKNNAAESAGLDKGAVSRFIRQRIFSEHYDLKVLRSLLSEIQRLRAELDHAVKVTLTKDDDNSINGLLQENILILTAMQQELSDTLTGNGG